MKVKTVATSYILSCSYICTLRVEHLSAMQLLCVRNVDGQETLDPGIMFCLSLGINPNL